MNKKSLLIFGVPLGVALLGPTPAGAHAPGPVHQHHGDVTFELTGADETLVITGGGSEALIFNYTVDGQTTTSTVDGFTGDLRIDDPAGTATLTVTDLTVPGDLTVATGPGADQIALGWRNNLPAEIQVGGDLDLRTDGGDDRISLAGSVASHAGIRTDGGADAVSLGGFDPGSLPHRFTAASLSITTGDGPDSVLAAMGGTTGATEVDLGAGDDSLLQGVIGRNLGCNSFDPGTGLQMDGRSGADTITWTCGTVGADAELRTGPGIDRLRLGEIAGPGAADSRPVSVARDLTIDTGTGGDTLDVRTATTGRHLSVETGAGPDSVHLGTPTNRPYVFTVAGRVTIGLGSNDDAVELELITLPNLDLGAGGGDDTVTLTGATVTGPASLDGGPGRADRLGQDAATVFGQPPRVTRFEL